MDNTLKTKLSNRLLWFFGLSDMKTKKVSSISEEEWECIERWVNHYLNDFLLRLRTAYPGLTRNDLHICCLVRLKLPRSYVAFLMGISPSSVSTCKLRIKKKLEIQRQDFGGDKCTLDTYLLIF